MSRLRIILLVLVCAPLLVYGGIKGYANYSIRNQLEDMIRLVSPFAVVEYGGVGSSFEGTLSVEDIRILPHGMAEAIRLDAVDLHTPGLWFLVKGGGAIRSEGFPERLGASVRGLQLNMDGQIMAAMMSHSEGLSQGRNPRADGLACGWRKLFTPESFRNLGYSTLSYDIDLLMLRPGFSDELTLRLETRAHDLQYLKLEIALAGFTYPPAGASGLRMKNFAVRYGLDPGYVEKALVHCATNSDLSVDLLLERLAGQDDAAYMADLGFVPGPGIRNALISYFRNPGEVRIDANPPWAVNLGVLERYKPQDLRDRLNVSVSLDQVEISDLSFKNMPVGGKDPSSRHSAGAPGSGSHARKTRSNNRDRGDQILRRGGYYLPVSKERIPDLLGRDIWVLTRSGLERQGRVVKVENGLVWLTLRLRGGSMTTSVALADTDQLGVRTRRP